MINIDLLQEQLIVAMVVSVITVAFIQKTKGMFKKSKHIQLYSFIVNLVLGVLFSIYFTETTVVGGLWVGLFAFLGADALYQALEGKIKSFSDLTKKEDIVEIPRGDI